MTSQDWRVIAIDVDSYAGRIAKSIEKLYGLKVKRINVETSDIVNDADLRLEIDKGRLLEKLEEAGVPKDYSETGKTLFILGNGRYHHLTHALARLSGKEGYGVVDWDAHTDDDTYVSRTGESSRCGTTKATKQKIRCGTFADLLTEDCGATSLVYIGSSSEPCFRQSKWVTKWDLYANNIENLTRRAMKSSREDEFYATIDLDVLDSDENVRVYKEWTDDGSIKLNRLVESIRTVRQEKRIFAADICGHELSAPDGGSKRDKLITEKTALAVSLLAGEMMGLDTASARNAIKEVDLKIRYEESKF